ncbi:hypothetical protein [Streptomyces tateyamensis]|uniref:hypothetical protein n=1 Tax=Streptomyces tateyamensis TaxID=565073 RepID=UPI0015E896B7|nr:hypothetical protein [Streptomyces tateyamensis]
MPEPRMTLRVYRLAPDGTRTDLTATETAGVEPDGSRFLEDHPCRCQRCCAQSGEPA